MALLAVLVTLGFLFIYGFWRSVTRLKKADAAMLWMLVLFCGLCPPLILIVAVIAPFVFVFVGAHGVLAHVFRYFTSQGHGGQETSPRVEKDLQQSWERQWREREDQEWQRREQETRNRQIQIVRSVIRQHVETLRVRRLQTRRTDWYGNRLDAKWYQEIEYFYTSTISPRLEDNTTTDLSLRFPHWHDRDSPWDIIKLVNEELDAYELSRPAPMIDADSLTFTEFEDYCVKLLRESGWNARGTKGSGDQGIDIVAKQQGKKAVFQCKKYSKPVGNGAVQEAHAGRSYESADLAFVVSNADFTPTARELAATCAVHLIHYSELSELDRFLNV
jgi:restriction system protein